MKRSRRQQRTGRFRFEIRTTFAAGGTEGDHSSSFFLLPSVVRRVCLFLRQFVALADAFPAVRVPALPAGLFVLQPVELFPRRLAAVVEPPVVFAALRAARVPVLPAGPFVLQPVELFPRRLAVVERPVASAVPPAVCAPVPPAGLFGHQPVERFLPRRLAAVERPVASAVPPVVCAPAPAAGLFGYQPVEPSLLRRSAAVVEGPVVSAARMPALPPEISGLATIRRP